MTSNGPPGHPGRPGQPAAGDVRLEVSGLGVRARRGGAEVVSDVSFQVRAGEVLGLVGESGSGKTTVALALLGHARRGLRISAGEVRLDGSDLLRLGPADLRRARGARVAYVPQDPSAALNPTLRIGTQLAEAFRVHPGVVGDPAERITQIMQEASLDPSPAMLRRYPHQLSGGQQQRVALAMAFACRPELIVLDEPTTGLDVSVQRRVLDTIRELCRSYRVAAVYVTHDLAVVEELADHVAVMYVGRLVEIGTAEDVFKAPAHPYTQGLLQAIPSVVERRSLRGIGGHPPRPGALPTGCSFAPRCPKVIQECSA